MVKELRRTDKSAMYASCGNQLSVRIGGVATMTGAIESSSFSATIDCYSAEFGGNGPYGVATYAEVLKSSFDFSIPDFALHQPFFARAELRFLPDLIVSRAQSSASRLSRTGRTIASRATDQILVVTYTTGHFDVTIDGETRRVEPGQVLFVDLAREIAIEAPHVDNLCLAISRHRLEALVDRLDSAHGYIRPDDALSRLLRGMMERVITDGPAISVVDARGIADALFRVAAAAMAPPSRQSTNSGRATASLVDIKAFIEERLLEQAMGPQVLLEHFGITRSSLYRLFEPLGGVSAFIAKRRLTYAFRRLSDTRTARDRISRLAEELGYSHPSAFTRAFKDAFGLSPRNVQALAAHARDHDVPLMTTREPLQFFTPLDKG